MKQRLTGFSELGYAQTHAPFQVIGNRMAQHAPALAYKIILAVVAWCMLAPAWGSMPFCVERPCLISLMPG